MNDGSINQSVSKCPIVADRLIVSGHDISDGGLITAILEMAFAGNCGLDITIAKQETGERVSILSNGKVLQWKNVQILVKDEFVYRIRKRKNRGTRYKARSGGRSCSSLAFLSRRNAETLEPTTARTAVSSPSASTRYLFLQLSGLGPIEYIIYRI